MIAPRKSQRLVEGLENGLAATERGWANLKVWRIFAGFAAAALAYSVLNDLSRLFSGQLELAALGVNFAWFFFGSIVLGWIYLLLVTRKRGRIARRECLFIGVLVSDAIWVLGYAIALLSGVRDELLQKITPFDAAITLIDQSIFGIIVGFIFWRVGIAPNRTAQSLAPVFD